MTITIEILIIKNRSTGISREKTKNIIKWDKIKALCKSVRVENA